jgi:hypothetical protein
MSLKVQPIEAGEEGVIMSYRCEGCQKSMPGHPAVTANGRHLCRRCNEQLIGGEGGVTSGAAASTAGWTKRSESRSPGAKASGHTVR